MCANLLRNVDTKLPGDTTSIKAVRILNAVYHSQDGTSGLEVRVTQKELKKILKEYLETNLPMWDDNIKMDIEEASFDFRLNSSIQHRSMRDFRKI